MGNQLDPEKWKTPRLEAFRINQEHLKELNRLHTDKYVMNVLSPTGKIFSIQETKVILEEYTSHWFEYGYGFWCFFNRQTGDFIGRAGLKNYEINEFNNKKIIGIAYAVLSSFWNQGYATEMSREILKFAFDSIFIEEIGGWALPDNKKSLHILEKLGFKYQQDINFAGLEHRYYHLINKDYFHS